MSSKADLVSSRAPNEYRKDADERTGEGIIRENEKLTDTNDIKCRFLCP